MGVRLERRDTYVMKSRGDPVSFSLSWLFSSFESASFEWPARTVSRARRSRLISDRVTGEVIVVKKWWTIGGGGSGFYK